MKKNRIALAIILIILVMTLVACGDTVDAPDKDEYVVTIHPNNGEEAFEWKVTDPIPNLTYEGYVLEGFYVDSDFTSSISLSTLKITGLNGNIDVYIKWKKEECEHDVVIDDAVPATCTEKGLTEGKHCSKCDEVILAQTEVPATGHTDGAWITDIEPTCTVEGSKHQVCSVCGDSIKTESIDATGHTDGAWITDIEPTCTEPGSKHQVCSTCGATTKTESITTEHTFGKWITIIEVTSTEAGLQQRTCECGEIETRDMSFVYDAYGYKDLANNSNGQARQQLYLSLYNACEKFASNKEYVEAVNGLYLIESIDIADMDIGDAVAVWKVFYVENPIFYWLSNTVTINAEKLSLCIDQDYAAADYREQCDLTIKDMVLDCNSNITIGMSDLEKALAIHDFIVTRMNYAYQSDGITPVDESWAHNMIGCAKYNLGVCESYAKTYQYLCDLNGLECITVTGIGGDEKHAWNLININNTWYGVDATWNDTGMDTLSYIYFGMSEHRLNDGHTAEIFESTGVDYLYRLPIVSSRSLELVDLYNREAFVGTFGNIDEAFAAMDDENGEYIIKLYEYPQNTSPYESDLFVVHSINNTQTLVAKSIMIIGTYFDLGDGLGICTELSINGSLTLQADSLILHDIFLSGEEPLYILDNCLEFSGVYSSVHIPIIGNIEDDANSKIICSTDSHVSFDNEVTVASFVGIENKNPDIDAVFAREAYILKFEGSLWVVSGNVYIRNFYGRNISLTPGSDHIEIKIGNILSEYAYIRVALSKVEAYPSITIGTSNGVIELSFYKHTASSANIFDITCPLSKLGNVAPENVIISLDGRGIITHLYEVNDNGEIVFNREHEHIDGFVLKGTHLLFYTGTQGDIIIPNDVTSIGVKAFSGCTNLESITIPGSVTSIDDEAFSYCNSLTSVTFEEGSQLASIGSQAFLQCTSLTSITIPASVTSIGSYAFYGCSSLTDVYYTGTEEEWNSIIIGTYNESLTNATIHYNYVATEV